MLLIGRQVWTFPRDVDIGVMRPCVMVMGCSSARRSVVPALWDTAAVAAPLDQAPAWVRDLLGSKREEAAADAEQAALLERVRAGEPGIAVSFEELASRLGLDQDPPSAGPAV
jgi:hypothetical protein